MTDLDISNNAEVTPRLDRRALEKRLVELQGDVSRLVSKLARPSHQHQQEFRVRLTHDLSH
jgi:hypothetical protein